MIRFVVLLVVAVCHTVVMAQNAAPAAKRPWPREVRQVYDGLKAECREMGGKFIPDRDRFATEVEVTNDGRPDWILAYDAAACSTSASGYCGTAGCVIEIMGSGRSGLTSIYRDNVGSWDVVEVRPGQKGLRRSLHATACNAPPGEVCRVTTVWDGRKWSVAGTRIGYTAEERQAMEAEAAAWQPPPPHEARWVFAGKGADAIAAVTDHPSLVALAARCSPQGEVYLAIMPREGLGLPPAGAPLTFAFSGSAAEAEWTQALQPLPPSKDFASELPLPLRNLLAGQDSSLNLLASIDGGDEWQMLEPLSLAGSSAAIRQLEAECATISAPAPDGQVAVRAIIDRYYAQYRKPTSDWWSMPLSPAFQSAWDRALGPDGALDFDPWCACQDYDHRTFRHAIVKITGSGNRIEAIVKHNAEAYMVFIKDPSGAWLLDDIDGMKRQMLESEPGSWSLPD